MSPFQTWKSDTVSPTTTSAPSWPSNTSTVFDSSTTNFKTDISGPALADVAIVIGLCALLIAVLQLCAEYQRGRNAQEVESEWIDLEAEFSERIRERLRRREALGS